MAKARGLHNGRKNIVLLEDEKEVVVAIKQGHEPQQHPEYGAFVPAASWQDALIIRDQIRALTQERASLVL